MRKLALPLVACFAFTGLAATPAALAAPAKASQTKKSSIGKQLSAVRGTLKGVQKAVKNLQDIDTGHLASINDAHAKGDKNKATIDAILANVPTIVGGLQALEKALKDEVGPGLKALKAVLEETVAPALKQLEAGLLTLQGVGTQLAQNTAAAAGTGDPATAGTKTSDANPLIPAVDTSTLLPGTTYRQFVVLADSNVSGAIKAALAGTPAAALPLGVRTWVKMPNVTGVYANEWACTSGVTMVKQSELVALGVPAGGGTPFAEAMSAASAAQCPA